MNKLRDYVSVCVGYLSYFGFLCYESSFSSVISDSAIVPIFVVSLMLVFIYQALRTRFSFIKGSPIVLVLISISSYSVVGTIIQVVKEGVNSDQIYILLVGSLASIPLALVRWDVWVFAILPLILTYYVLGRFFNYSEANANHSKV